VCEELDVVLNIHADGTPDFGTAEAARAMLIRLAWCAHRAVWHLTFGGVLERHPHLRVVLTEQGTSWIPRGLETLDWFHRRMTHGGAAAAVFFGAVAKSMSLTPTEYFQRNFWVGASFLRPSESPLRYEIGVDRLMWGADYRTGRELPVHHRGATPRSRMCRPADENDAETTTAHVSVSTPHAAKDR
jgi:predicted TIM-barrel fold metal-dependent hydrolase